MASADSEKEDLVSISSKASVGENDVVVRRFTIDNEINTQYTRFNAVGTDLTVRPYPCSRG